MLMLGVQDDYAAAWRCWPRSGGPRRGDTRDPGLYPTIHARLVAVIGMAELN